MFTNVHRYERLLSSITLFLLSIFPEARRLVRHMQVLSHSHAEAAMVYHLTPLVEFFFGKYFLTALELRNICGIENTPFVFKLMNFV